MCVTTSSSVLHSAQRPTGEHAHTHSCEPLVWKKDRLNPCGHFPNPASDSRCTLSRKCITTPHGGTGENSFLPRDCCEIRPTWQAGEWKSSPAEACLDRYRRGRGRETVQSKMAARLLVLSPSFLPSHTQMLPDNGPGSHIWKSVFRPIKMKNSISAHKSMLQWTETTRNRYLFEVPLIGDST